MIREVSHVCKFTSQVWSICTKFLEIFMNSLYNWMVTELFHSFIGELSLLYPRHCTILIIITCNIGPVK